MHDNVAPFQLNGLTAQNLELRTGALRRFFSEDSGGECRLTLAVYRLPAVTHMTWLARDGRIVHHALVQFALYVGTHQTIPLPPRCSSSG